MTMEVYSTSKPVSARRAIILSMLLLLFTTFLAADFSFRHEKEADKNRFQPDQWDISFRLPKAFQKGEMLSTEIGQAVPYQFELQPGIKIELSIWRLRKKAGTNPVEPSQTLMSWLHTQSSWSLIRLLKLGPPPSDSLIAKLGSFDAYEIIDPRISAVVRAGKISNGQSYGVSMIIYGISLGPELYRLFERTCLSIKLETN